MSETLQIINFESLNIVEETTLGSNITSGTAIVTLENSDNITSTSYVRVGDGEKAEIRLGESLSGLDLTVTANLTFSHINGEKIIRLRGNQIRIYRASNVDGTTPDDEDFTLLATESIQADQRFTQYYDEDGGSSYWYKFTYYNVTTGDETSLSDCPAVRGGQVGQLVQVDDIKKEAGIYENKYIDDTQVFVRRDQATDEIKSVLYSAGYVLPLTDSEGAEYTPPMIENIALILAAGYVLSRDYGATDTVKKEEGDAKIKFAQKKLEQIRNGTLSLIDRYGVQLSKTASLSGWPDNTTKDVEEENAGGERMFSVKKVF